jgi:V/A-type H+/Na+-transporting ATPase subunit E
MESGKEKIQQICDILKKETLEPAKQEALEVVENAQMQAKEILASAQKEYEELIQKGKRELEQKKKSFESSLVLACNKTLADFKQKIEKKLFNDSLKSVLAEAFSKADVVANLVSAVIKAIEQEGIESEISVYIPKSVSAREVNKLLLSDVLAKIKEKEVLVGDFEGGAKIKLYEGDLTLDISDAALQESVASFIREDFRQLLFKI